MERARAVQGRGRDPAARAVSDYAYVIAEGRLFSEGLPATLAAMPEIRRAYLGL
jgi:branched-chain amino acid transport system ATP-binding protein